MRHIPLPALVIAVLVSGCSLFDSRKDEHLSSITFIQNTNGRYLWQMWWDDRTVDEGVQGIYVVRTVGTNQSLHDMTGLIELAHFAEGNPGNAARSWFSQSSRRLTEVAYRNAGATPVVTPKHDSFGRIGTNRFPTDLPVTVARILDQKGMEWPAFYPDSLFMREDPRIVYEYPLTKGRTWVSFTDPFLTTRKVVGTETVRVAAGEFHCVKILTTIPESDFLWYDYVATDGLILREIVSEVELIDERGIPFGTATLHERLELIEKR